MRPQNGLSSEKDEFFILLFQINKKLATIEFQDAVMAFSTHLQNSIVDSGLNVSNHRVDG